MQTASLYFRQTIFPLRPEIKLPPLGCAHIDTLVISAYNVFMARRYLVFTNNEIYHVFNKSIARQPIFDRVRTNSRALDVLSYYRFHKPRLRFSHLPRLRVEEKQIYFNSLDNKNKRQVDVLAFCLMPNHYHLLLKQVQDDGISNYIATFQNSFAKYYNIISKRTGSLFQHMFKAVRIETDEQFIHVARYIHLNPYSSYILKEIGEIESYRWSSFRNYVNTDDSFINKEPLLKLFSSKKNFMKFTIDNADYQRKLELIRHLTLED